MSRGGPAAACTSKNRSERRKRVWSVHSWCLPLHVHEATIVLLQSLPSRAFQHRGQAKTHGHRQSHAHRRITAST
jgi:hypothetical protein